MNLDRAETPPTRRRSRHRIGDLYGPRSRRTPDFATEIAGSSSHTPLELEAPHTHPNSGSHLYYQPQVRWAQTQNTHSQPMATQHHTCVDHSLHVLQTVDSNVFHRRSPTHGIGEPVGDVPKQQQPLVLHPAPVTSAVPPHSPTPSKATCAPSANVCAYDNLKYFAACWCAAPCPPTNRIQLANDGDQCRCGFATMCYQLGEQ